MKKIINGICVALAFIFLGIGAVGIVLPILPTTPFLLLAAFLFAKGSGRFHKWFVGTNIYKKYMEQAVTKKTMTKTAKRKVLTTLGIIFVIGFAVSPIWHAKVLILVVAAVHFYYFLLRIKTEEETEPEFFEQNGYRKQRSNAEPGSMKQRNCHTKQTPEKQVCETPVFKRNTDETKTAHRLVLPED